jgi:amylosucrase
MTATTAPNPYISTRFKQYEADFWHAYHALYPKATKGNIESLKQVLEDAFDQRAERLRQLDQERIKAPMWFQDPKWVGMMLYVDLFADDLKGVMRKIPYFKELGINYIHLMPVLKAREGPNDGGYAVADYRRVDARFGSMDDLRELALKLHEEGMLLVIDYVMNHTAKEHEWAQAAVKGDPYYQAFYRMFEDRTLPDMYERTLPEVFPDFAPGNFTYQPEIDKWVWTTFYDFQWDLNYENPDVFEAMLSEMLFLANVGVDVLRLDAVPFLWKRMGTNCQNQPEAVQLLVAMKALVQVVAPAMLFKSEAIVAPDDIIKYLGSGGYEGKACEVGYNATLMNHLWHALACENTQLLRTTLSSLPHLPDSATWINYIRCHDDIGWGISDENAAAVQQSGRGTRNFCTDFYTGVLPQSYAEGYAFQRDRNTGEARVSGTAAALAGLQKAQVENDLSSIDQSIKRLKLLNGITFFMKGIPLVYAGDEVGQLNDFSYLTDEKRAGDNRWVHRPPMNWKKAKKRKNAQSIEAQVFAFHQLLINRRKSFTPLHGCGFEQVIPVKHNELFIAERGYEGEKALLVANFSRSNQRISLKDLPEFWQSGIFRDVLSGQVMNLRESGVLLKGYEVFWLIPALVPNTSETGTATLEVEVRTEYGESIWLIGSSAALGRWNPDLAVPCASTYYPKWTAEIEMNAGEGFAYRWIKKRGNKIVEWATEEYVDRVG